MDTTEKLIPLLVRFPADMHLALKKFAANERRSLNAQVLVLMQDALERRDRELELRERSPTSPAR